MFFFLEMRLFIAPANKRRLCDRSVILSLCHSVNRITHEKRRNRRRPNLVVIGIRKYIPNHFFIFVSMSKNHLFCNGESLQNR